MNEFDASDALNLILHLFNATERMKKKCEEHDSAQQILHCCPGESLEMAAEIMMKAKEEAEKSYNDLKQEFEDKKREENPTSIYDAMSLSDMFRAASRILCVHPSEDFLLVCKDRMEELHRLRKEKTTP